MKRIFKSCITALLLLCGIFCFAEEETSEAVKFGVTDSDIQNFVKNADKINAELERYNVKLDNMDQNSANTLETLPELESILGKYGISGESHGHRSWLRSGIRTP